MLKSCSNKAFETFIRFETSHLTMLAISSQQENHRVYLFHTVQHGRQQSFEQKVSLGKTLLLFEAGIWKVPASQDTRCKPALSQLKILMHSTSCRDRERDRNRDRERDRDKDRGRDRDRERERRERDRERDRDRYHKGHRQDRYASLPPGACDGLLARP